MSYHWEWGVVIDNLPVFLWGMMVTVLITAASSFFGLVAGTLLAVLRLSHLAAFRWVSAIVEEMFLAIPVLVLMIWLYYCIPMAFPRLRLSATATAILALSLSLSAFVAQIVRAGISSVPQNQSEVAWVLGLSRMQILLKIILPQAIRVMLPPLTGQIITCWKLSSLASVIAVYELLHAAQNLISQTFRPLEVYTAVAVLYLVSIVPANILSRRLGLPLSERSYLA